MDFLMWCGEMNGTIQSVCVKNPVVNILCLLKFDICLCTLIDLVHKHYNKVISSQTKVWWFINFVSECIEHGNVQVNISPSLSS